MPRPAFFGLAAILVPAAIVTVLGYLSLRQWQASAELLFREQARDMAAMTVDKIQMVLRRSDDETLARLQAALDRGDAASLAAVRATTPLVENVYLLDVAGRLLYPATPAAGDELLLTALRGEAAVDARQRGSRRELVVAGRPVLVAVLRSSTGAPVLAALARSLEGLRRDVFDAALRPLETPALYAVLDEQGRSLYRAGPLERAQLVAEVAFRDVFPTWRLALYQRDGASPRAAVRRQVAVFTGALAVLLAVIVAGSVATYRLVRRETEMARLKADFVANVSHDLKTPLSVIRMFGETLEMGRVSDEAARREYYRVITRESERLSRLIDNVLDFSRIEGGRRTYDRVPTTVEPLVRETLEAFAYPLAQGGFTVDVRVASDLPEVALDADAVGQALANLVDNAIKYSGARRSLTVQARVVDGRLALSVADEGIGIPAAEQERIFDKFYRVGRSDTQGRRGSGVGLALVRHVAEAHGGRVSVESRPGEGSRFTLWIPLG